MTVPEHVIWGAAAFLALNVIKIGFKLLKDVDHAHINNRALEKRIRTLEDEPRRKN